MISFIKIYYFSATMSRKIQKEMKKQILLKNNYINGRQTNRRINVTSVQKQYNSKGDRCQNVQQLKPLLQIRL